MYAFHYGFRKSQMESANYRKALIAFCA